MPSKILHDSERILYFTLFLWTIKKIVSTWHYHGTSSIAWYIWILLVLLFEFIKLDGTFIILNWPRHWPTNSLRNANLTYKIALLLYKLNGLINSDPPTLLLKALLFAVPFLSHTAATCCLVTAKVLVGYISIAGKLTPHLSSLIDRIYGECVRTDVHYHAQLEPIGWVGRPHRLPILHCTPQLHSSSGENTHRVKSKDWLYWLTVCKACPTEK